jgi:hypothetical protein
VVDGAFAELPHYFADADRVMDRDAPHVVRNPSGPQSRDLVSGVSGRRAAVRSSGAPAAYVASKSDDSKYAASSTRRKRKRRRWRWAKRSSIAGKAPTISPAHDLPRRNGRRSRLQACRSSRTRQAGKGDRPMADLPECRPHR